MKKLRRNRDVLSALLPLFKFFDIINSHVGEKIPENGDAQRQLLYASADHALHKVWNSCSSYLLDSSSYLSLCVQ